MKSKIFNLFANCPNFRKLMLFRKDYKGYGKDAVLLGDIAELAKNEECSPQDRLNQIDKCVASYWKQLLVRKVLDFRTEAGASSSFHFDDKMSLRKLLLGCWEAKSDLSNYLNSVEELEEFIVDELGDKEVERISEEEE